MKGAPEPCVTRINFLSTTARQESHHVPAALGRNLSNFRASPRKIYPLGSSWCVPYPNAGLMTGSGRARGSFRSKRGSETGRSQVQRQASNIILNSTSLQIPRHQHERLLPTTVDTEPAKNLPQPALLFPMSQYPFPAPMEGERGGGVRCRRQRRDDGGRTNKGDKTKQSSGVKPGKTVECALFLFHDGRPLLLDCVSFDGAMSRL